MNYAKWFLPLIMGITVSSCHVNQTHHSNKIVDAGLETSIADAPLDIGSDVSLSDVQSVKLCDDDMVLITPKLPFTLPLLDKAKFAESDYNFDMTAISGAYCIDRYEYPNKKGSFPISGISLDTAKYEAAKLGKRICSQAEWVAACMGENRQIYGYGNEYVPGNCTDSKPWKAPSWGLMANPVLWAQEVKRLYNADPSGSHPNCKSTWGNDALFDAIANTAEWSLSSKAQYGVAVMGCSFVNCYRPQKASCLYSNVNHSANFNSYEFGYRLCKNP
jgi:hypothetical protein